MESMTPRLYSNGGRLTSCFYFYGVTSRIGTSGGFGIWGLDGGERVMRNINMYGVPYVTELDVSTIRL